MAATDTLNAVLARITASEAGVTASYDTQTDTVRLTSKTVGPTPITLGSDTSGFLAAVKLDGTQVGTPGRMPVESIAAPQGRLNAAAVDPVTAAIAKVNAALDRLMGARDESEDFRTSILNAVRGAVAGASASETGLALARANGKETVVIDAELLAQALTNNPQALDGLVSGEAGLPEALSAALESDEEAAAPALPTVTLVDTRGIAEHVRAARLATNLRTLQLLASLPAASPRRLDMLV